MSKWYGKIICPEGIVNFEVFDTEAEARAFAKGAEAGMYQADPDQDYLNTCVDQLEPADE